MGNYGCMETKYGFAWGPAQVVRLMSDPKWGVILEVKSGKQAVEIRITPSGLIRIGNIEKPVDRGE